MDAQDLGPEWGKLNAREKVELVQLKHQLHEHGIAVQEAHAALVQLLKGKLVPLDTEKAAEAYVEPLGKKRLRPSYLKTQRNRVKMLAERFAGRPVHEISLPDLEGWLHSMTISPRYFANLKLSWRTFFNWCLKRHHVEECVASKLEVPAADEKEPGILSPELVEQLLHRLQQQAPEHLPFLQSAFLPDAGRTRSGGWTGQPIDRRRGCCHRQPQPPRAGGADWCRWSLHCGLGLTGARTTEGECRTQ